MCTCIENLAKWFLLATNSLTFLVALFVLGISIWVLVDQPSFLKVLNVADDIIGGFDDLKIYQSATIVLLVIAVLVIIITFFGCCGAAQESRCLLATYFAFDVLLLIGAGVGAYFVFTGNLTALKTPFISALKEYDDTSNVASDQTLVKAWDAFQQDFKCCGVDSFNDWAEMNEHFGARTNDPYSSSTTSRPNYNSRGSGRPNQQRSNIGPDRRVPKSCCDPALNQGNCSANPQSSNGLYSIGCFKLVVEEIESHEAIIGSVALTIVVIMVVNAIISIYMATCGYYVPEGNRSKRGYARP